MIFSQELSVESYGGSLSQYSHIPNSITGRPAWRQRIATINSWNRIKNIHFMQIKGRLPSIQHFKGYTVYLNAQCLVFFFVGVVLVARILFLNPFFLLQLLTLHEEKRTFPSSQSTVSRVKWPWIRVIWPPLYTELFSNAFKPVFNCDSVFIVHQKIHSIESTCSRTSHVDVTSPSNS